MGANMSFLIFYTKGLIILSYLIIGLFIVDMAKTTTIIDMDLIDYLICLIGTLFIIFSFWLLAFFSSIKKGV
jgi:hypothetical protein